MTLALSKNLPDSEKVNEKSNNLLMMQAFRSLQILVGRQRNSYSIRLIIQCMWSFSSSHFERKKTWSITGASFLERSTRSVRLWIIRQSSYRLTSISITDENLVHLIVWSHSNRVWYKNRKVYISSSLFWNDVMGFFSHQHILKKNNWINYCFFLV